MPKNLKDAVIAFHEYFTALCSQIDPKFKNIKVKIEAFKQSLDELQKNFENIQEPEACAKFAVVVENFIDWFCYKDKDKADDSMTMNEVMKLMKYRIDFTWFLIGLIKDNNPAEIISGEANLLIVWKIFFQQIASKENEKLLKMQTEVLYAGIFERLGKVNCKLEGSSHEAQINRTYILYISENIKKYNDILGGFFLYLCDFCKRHKPLDETSLNMSIRDELSKFDPSETSANAIGKIFEADKIKAVQHISSLMPIIACIHQGISCLQVQEPKLKDAIKTATHEGLTSIAKYYFPVNPDTLFFLKRSSRRTPQQSIIEESLMQTSSPAAAEAKEEASAAQASSLMPSTGGFN